MGGGIFVNNVDVDLINSNISYCHASDDSGGGIFASGENGIATVTMRQSTFLGCYTTNYFYGQCLALSQTEAFVYDTAFLWCQAPGGFSSTAAIWISDSTLTAEMLVTDGQEEMEFGDYGPYGNTDFQTAGTASWSCTSKCTAGTSVICAWTPHRPLLIRMHTTPPVQVRTATAQWLPPMTTTELFRTWAKIPIMRATSIALSTSASTAQVI